MNIPELQQQDPKAKLEDSLLKEELGAIPRKLSFRIGEAAKIIGVKPYILRYWESEFEQLKPSKLENKQRLYFHKDIETLLLIKKLLYKDGYSIRGAKQALKPLDKKYQKLKSEQKSKEKSKDMALNLLGGIKELKTFVNG